MFYIHNELLDWDWYTKSTINFDTGKWTTTFAGFSGLTPVGSAGPLWNNYQSPSPTHLLMATQPDDPVDPAHAKYGGRLLARALINMEVWDKSSEMWKGR
jgi:hypothetical protein